MTALPPPTFCPRASPSECAGSVEMTSVESPASARATPSAADVDVFPTPPLPPRKMSCCEVLGLGLGLGSTPGEVLIWSEAPREEQAKEAVGSSAVLLFLRAFWVRVESRTRTQTRILCVGVDDLGCVLDGGAESAEAVDAGELLVEVGQLQELEGVIADAEARDLVQSRALAGDHPLHVGVLVHVVEVAHVLVNDEVVDADALLAQRGVEPNGLLHAHARGDGHHDELGLRRVPQGLLQPAHLLLELEEAVARVGVKVGRRGLRAGAHSEHGQQRLGALQVVADAHDLGQQPIQEVRVC
mmetsp:Transcript_29212/g.93579  ORF Transcript_29212/g.93579 Transcript_29212/m.93579 type:complete len:300 (+) Transcript_29212:2068-2967(+)